jgi:hypothetical protein
LSKQCRSVSVKQGIEHPIQNTFNKNDLQSAEKNDLQGKGLFGSPFSYRAVR